MFWRSDQKIHYWKLLFNIFCLCLLYFTAVVCFINKASGIYQSSFPHRNNTDTGGDRFAVEIRLLLDGCQYRSTQVDKILHNYNIWSRRFCNDGTCNQAFNNTDTACHRFAAEIRLLLDGCQYRSTQIDKILHNYNIWSRRFCNDGTCNQAFTCSFHSARNNKILAKNL